MAESDRLRFVGRDLPLDEAEAKAAGRLKYTADQPGAGQVWLKLVLSESPHAEVLEVLAPESAGLLKVYSWANTPRTTFNSQKWFSGQPGPEDQAVLARTARHVGDPVAAVAAESRSAALAGAELVQVRLSPRPFVVDPEAALANQVLIHGPAPAAVIRLAHGQEGPEPEGVAVEDLIETPRIHHAALEPHVCRAEPKADGGVVIYSPCQIVASVQLTTAQVLGLPLAKVRVIKTPCGGSFGGKQEVTHEPLAAFVALDLNRPVILELDRRETILATRTRTRVIGRVRTILDPTGLILSRAIRCVVDTGAYTSNGPVLAAAMGKKAFRLYRIPRQSYEAQVVHTNAPVAGAARGYGSPQIHALSELNLDQAARRLGLDPLEVRRRNLVRPHDPDPLGGPGLGNARILDCLEQGAAAFGWVGRRARPRDRGRFRRGVGLACATHGNGYFGVYQDFTTMTLRFLPDGGLGLNAALHELGHGVVTVVKQIIAEVLGVDPARISAPEADTDLSPADIGCQASRVTFVLGGCALKAAEALRDRLLAEAARLLGRPAAGLRLGDGRLWSVDRPEEKIPLGDLVARLQRRQVDLIVTETHAASANPGSYAANFAAVEVDSLTGLVRVTDLLAAHDVGRAINPGFVRSQIHGGVQMGLGLALGEDLRIDPATGRPLADRLGRYYLANAPEMPPLEVLLVEAGEEQGPFGAKSVGELATVAVAPAVVNAVNHALGTNLTRLPLTPEKILAGLAQGSE